MAYRGQSAVFPLGIGGLVGDPDTDRFASLTKAANIRFHGQRLLRDRGLADLDIELSGEGPITGISNSRVFGDSGLIISRGSSIYGPNFEYNLESFVPSESSISFIEAGKENQGQPPKVFAIAPTFVPILIKGQDPQPMENIPPEWLDSPPRTGFVHRNRMFFVAGHSVYFSDPSDHEYIFGPEIDDDGEPTENQAFHKSSGVISIYPGEGNYIIAGASFRGLAVLWKYPQGIYVINTPSSDTATWSVSKLNNDLGCVSAQGYVPINNDILFMDPSGNLHLLSAVDTTGDINSSNLSRQTELTEWARDNLDISRVEEVRMTYDSVNSEANIIYPNKDGNNYRLIADFSHRDGVRFRESDAVNYSVAFEYEETVSTRSMLVGTKNGRVYQVHQRTNPASDNYLVAGASIETPWFTFDHIDPRFNFLRKDIDFLEMEINYVGQLNLRITIESDYDYDRKTRVINLDNTDGFFLGQSVLGRDEFIEINTSTGRFSRRVGLSGVQFRMRIEDRGSADWEIVQTKLDFRVTDNRLTDTGTGDG